MTKGIIGGYHRCDKCGERYYSGEMHECTKEVLNDEK